MEGFEGGAPLVDSPLDEPIIHLPLKAVDLDSQSGVPGELPLPPQPVFQACFILNARRNRGPWVVTCTTLGSGSYQSPKNGAGEVLNTRVDSN
jgi:hypothetical protein